MGAKESKKVKGSEIGYERDAIPDTPSKIPFLTTADLEVMRGVIQIPNLLDIWEYAQCHSFAFTVIKGLSNSLHNVTLEESTDRDTCNLLLLNKNDRKVRVINLWGKSREECNDVLFECGFFRKKNRKDSIPTQYLNGPYKTRKIAPERRRPSD